MYMMCMYLPVRQLWHPLHSLPSLEEGIPYYSFLLKIYSLLITLTQKQHNTTPKTQQHNANPKTQQHNTNPTATKHLPHNIQH